MIELQLIASGTFEAKLLIHTAALYTVFYLREAKYELVRRGHEFSHRHRSQTLIVRQGVPLNTLSAKLVLFTVTRCTRINAANTLGNAGAVYELIEVATQEALLQQVVVDGTRLDFTRTGESRFVEL